MVDVVPMPESPVTSLPGVQDLVCRGSRATIVLRTAIHERILRDGGVHVSPLRRWLAHDTELSLTAHPWEEGLVPETTNRYDTLGKTAYQSEIWPEGQPSTAQTPPSPVRVIQHWTVAGEERASNANALPPVGPYMDSRIYPNGRTWCIEAEGGDADRLDAWPFPSPMLELHGLEAERIDMRRLFRQWLSRGLLGGAYGRHRCAARARTWAWRSLATLVGRVDSAEALVAATAQWEVWGFRSRGEWVQPFGSDFGWMIRMPDGHAWASAHSDSD